MSQNDAAVFVYLLSDAPRGFRTAWEKTNLKWNGERAGLLSLRCTGSLECAERQHSNMLGFTVKAIELLPPEDLIWDLFSFSVVVVVHGTLP